MKFVVGEMLIKQGTKTTGLFDFLGVPAFIGGRAFCSNLLPSRICAWAKGFPLQSLTQITYNNFIISSFGFESLSHLSNCIAKGVKNLAFVGRAKPTYFDSFGEI